MRELQRIALGRNPTARARDRLTALKELVKLDGGPSRQTIVNVNPWARGEMISKDVGEVWGR